MSWGRGRVREGWHFPAAKVCGGSTVGGLLVKFLHFCLRFRTFHGLLGGQKYRVDCPPLTSGVSWSPDSATTQLRSSVATGAVARSCATREIFHVAVRCFVQATDQQVNEK